MQGWAAGRKNIAELMSCSSLTPLVHLLSPTDDVDLFAEEDFDGEGLSRRGRRSRAGLERAGSGAGGRLARAASAKGKHNVVTTFNAQTQVCEGAEAKEEAGDR